MSKLHLSTFILKPLGLVMSLSDKCQLSSPRAALFRLWSSHLLTFSSTWCIDWAALVFRCEAGSHTWWCSCSSSLNPLRFSPSCWKCCALKLFQSCCCFPGHTLLLYISSMVLSLAFLFFNLVSTVLNSDTRILLCVHITSMGSWG